MGRANLITLLVFGVIILVFPLLITWTFGSESLYYLKVMTFAGINAIVCIGLSLLLGYAGQISIGQAGFFAIGAYASGILTVKFGYPIWFGLVAGVAFNCLIALVAGIPVLKLRGHYLAMATLAIGEIVHITANADTEPLVEMFLGAAWYVLGFFGYVFSFDSGPAYESLATWMKPFMALTSGPSGFAQIPNMSLPFWGPLTTRTQWFYLTWGVVLAFMILSLNLIHSRIGRALRAIHGNEEAARAMGVNTPPLKVGVFIISAAMASIAGSLYAHNVSFIAPGTFSINESILFVVMVAVGGMMNVWGAVIGALVMTTLPEIIKLAEEAAVKMFQTGAMTSHSDVILIMLYGLVLLLIMMFMPDGIVGLGQRLYRRLKVKSAR